MVTRFDIYLLNLDDEIGKHAKNTRPCVVVSPDEMNRNLNSVIIAPISSRVSKFPTRVPINVLNSDRSVILDQLRTVDKERLAKKIGETDKPTCKAIIAGLAEIFAE